MKRAWAALLIFVPTLAFANPYFRPLDLNHLQTVGGALIDPKDLANSELTGLLPLVTHDPSDGCILPSVVCEDWSPIAVGFSVNSGQWSLALGPVFNVLPWAKTALLAITPDSWSGFRGTFQSQDPNLTFSAGPMWEYKSATDKGYFRVFTGLALHFGGATPSAP